MLGLLLKGRADAVAIIEGALEVSTTRFPKYRQRIEKSQVPLLERVGYIMFSKRLYQEHAATTECFWTESARLMASDWFRDLKQSYTDR